MRFGGGGRSIRPPALPPLEGGCHILQPVQDGARSDRSVPLSELSGASPRLGSWNLGAVGAPAPDLLPVFQRRRGSRDAPNSARDRTQLEPLKRELPNLDFQVEIPVMSSRGLASFSNRRRILPTGHVGTRLAPLHQGNSLGLPLVEQDAPVPSLRPTCPWDPPFAPSDGSVSNRHRDSGEMIAATVALAAEESNGRHDSEDSSFESSAWAEVEKVMHSAFFEECSRGNSPTVSAVEAILRCRSGSKQGVLSY